MKNMEIEEISKVSGSSEHKAPDMKCVDKEGKSENIIMPPTEISMDSGIAGSAEQDSSIKVSDLISNDSSTMEIYKSSINEVVVSEEISKLVSDTVQIIVNDKSTSDGVPSVNGIVVFEEISHTCETVPIIINNSSSADVYKPSVNGIVVSEEISDTCDTVKIIGKDKSSMAEDCEPSVNEIAVSEEISKFISDTCNTVEIIVNNDAIDLAAANSDPTLMTATEDSEGIPEAFETANGHLHDVEMGDVDDDANTVPSSDKNESLINEEMNEEDEECSNFFVETDIKDPTNKEIHWTKRASLPYYRQPKPDFFEYTRKLQEKLEPKHSVINPSAVPNSSTQIIVLDEPGEHNNQEPDLLKSSTTGTYRNKTSTAFDICLEKSSRKPSEKPVSGLIILDDYKSPRVKNSHFSRSNDMWNLSSLNSTKEKPEPVPGAKYKALKEQLMEKIMLKKEESLNKRKAEQDVDEENFEEEEEIVSDDYGSEKGSSDDEMEDDAPENTEDVVLKDMLLKECKNFPENVSEETKDNIPIENSENEQFNPDATISEDSQEPMECYSLPSYQPGGGFSSSPLQKRSMKRIFSDSDFTDSAIDSPSQQKSMGRIFSDSDFIDSAPTGSSRSSQLKRISSLEFKDTTEEQLPFEGSDEQEIIPHWESLPISERQESQLFDEDISVICSGKFPSTNEDIPWTPSSSVKDSLPNKESVGSPSSNNHAINEPDQLDESDDEELIRPAKKIKLSLVEKLWDSEDEDDSNDPIAQNGELKGNHPEIQSDSDDDAEQDHGPDIDSDSEEEGELHDQSEISLKHADVSFEDSHVKDADNKESAKKYEIKNFFENEAELSGEEGSSDENEDYVDEYMEDEMITDEIVASEEKLRKEVGTIHFKRQQDEDEQILRQIKEDFLPEGELYNENGQRKRRYIWNNIGMDDNEFTETKSESEEEEIESLPTDYLKWQQEKNKSNLPEDDEEVQTPRSIGLKVDIIGKVSVTRCSSVSNSSISASPMLRRGSFLNSSIGKNLKFVKEFSSSEGSVSRKNFVFSSSVPQPNASLPSTPAPEVKSTRINNFINNRSIFNKI